MSHWGDESYIASPAEPKPHTSVIISDPQENDDAKEEEDEYGEGECHNISVGTLLGIGLTGVTAIAMFSYWRLTRKNDNAI